MSIAMLLACCACAFGLDPSRDVSQYGHTSWKIREGFPKGEIESIAQTPDGYLWLGTEFGLYRFDGVRATPWQPSGHHHLPADWVRSLLVSRDGTLWIGGRGLASLKNDKITEYPDLARFYIFALFEDHEGTLWVGAGGTPVGNLCAIRGGSVHCYGDDGTFGRFVGALLEDSAGHLWVGVRDGLWKWKPGPPKYYPLPGQPDGIVPLVENTDGALLVGWRGRIYRFADGKTVPYPLPGNLSQFQAGRILRDKDSSLWISTTDQGILHLHRERMDTFSSTDGLSGEHVRAFFEDREGNVWTSTTEGLDRFRDLAVTTLKVKQGLSRDVVGSVLTDKDGSLWFATSGGLNRWNDGQITIPSVGGRRRDGKPNGSVPNSLFQDDRGRTWLGTLGEFGYLENGRLSLIKGVLGGNFLSIAQDTTGNIWASNENAGLFRISRRNDVLHIPWSVLGHKDHTSVLAADPKQGGLWIGFFLGGIVYFSGGQVHQSYTATDGLGGGRISDFQLDSDGTLWISTEGGLSRLKNNHIATLTGKNGLPCDTVHWAIRDDQGSFWLYTACGLVEVPRFGLDAWAAAVDKGREEGVQVQVRVFDSSDGVRSLALVGHYHPQVAKTPDGKLWFLPWDGVSVIDPHHIPVNKIPPPVHIQQIVADRKIYDTGSETNGNLRLPPLIRDLEIDYTGLSLVAPEKNHFRYKLEGLDSEWHDVGNRRQAFYTNLPPRHYQFRVAAANNSGLWNEEGAFLDFAIAPAYYQTNWFRALCLAAFLGVFWMLYQLRVRQLAYQFNIRLEERVGERVRIARELHDTLLQTVQGLMLRLQVVDQMLPPGKAKEELEETLEVGDQAILEGRSTVRDLRSPLRTNDLAQAVRALGDELASGSSTTFRLVVEGATRELHPIVRDEFYRIAREALRNAFDHADAKQIEAEITYEDRLLRLRIRDDGQGMPAEILDEGRSGHFGLAGMRERAKQLGSKLTIWSGGGVGTEIDLSVAGSVAYAKPPAGSRFWRWGRKKVG